MMSRLVLIFSLVLFFLTNRCVASEIQPEINDFIQLLIKADNPTLAEYIRFSGESDSSELELFFELKECRSRGWADSSDLCINFVRNRWRTADQHNSLFLGWLREQFSTVGKNYRIVSVKSKTEGFSHELVEVVIGENKFLLFHNTEHSKPTGIVIGVSEVNGKNINYYFSKLE
ncbi:MAG: hypothetical protein HYV24_12215 [Deltaproteobacteria bacterium]|nr:hypothetical protein [Deltaproteobacteria bacterium]